jgi:hypothetical protein
MLNSIRNTTAALAFTMIFAFGVSAQNANQATQKADDDFVTEKGFKSKVFEVKYREAESLTKVLRTLGSGFKGASIAPSSEFKTLTVRDFPENITAIEEALKRLDTPAPPRPNIELHMYVLIASNTAGTAANTTAQAPTELKDVLTQLRQTINYKNYELATSVVQRLTETGRGLGGKGIAEISRSEGAAGATQSLPYQYSISAVSLASAPSGAPTVQIGEFAFSTAMTSQTLDNRTQVQTALNMRDGEKVVVGTAAFGDRALIIVLTAKLLN